MSGRDRIDDLIEDFRAGVVLHLEDGRDFVLRGEPNYVTESVHEPKRSPMKREMTVTGGDRIEFIGCPECMWSVALPASPDTNSAAAEAFNKHACSEWEKRTEPTSTLRSDD